MTLIDVPLISADDHMDVHVFPPELFVSRVPAAMRDRVPHVVEAPDGPWWEIQGRKVSTSGRKAAGMAIGDGHGYRPGIAEDRLADMDVDGIAASVVYGPPLGFTFIDDLEARVACQRAYNDWGAEFAAVDPTRLVVLPWLPGHDPLVATAELRRVADLGHRGVLVGYFEAVTPPFEDDWEPFWAAADDIGLPVHFHLGLGLHSIRFEPGTWRQPAAIAVGPMQLDEALVGMLFSGILERYPDVRLVLGEAGLGWVPYVLRRLDHEMERHRHAVGDRLHTPPSELFRRQILLTYEDDDLGLSLLDEIGAENVMWASDYPHGDSTWPHSHEVLEKSPLAGLAPDVRRRILHDNAAALYGLG